MNDSLYRVFPYRDEGDPPIPRPTLDVRLSYGGTGEWTTRALIDSGAPTTVFDRGAAEALTIRIGQAGARTGSLTLLGSTVQAQLELVHLCLPDNPEYEWETDVAFITDRAFQMPFQGILGSVGFLDRYAVTFDYYNNRFVVERPADWQDRVGRQLVLDPTQDWDPEWSPPG